LTGKGADVPAKTLVDIGSTLAYARAGLTVLIDAHPNADSARTTVISATMNRFGMIGLLNAISAVFLLGIGTHERFQRHAILF